MLGCRHGAEGLKGLQEIMERMLEAGGCALLIKSVWLTTRSYILLTVRSTCNWCRTAVLVWRRNWTAGTLDCKPPTLTPTPKACIYSEGFLQEVGKSKASIEPINPNDSGIFMTITIMKTTLLLNTFGALAAALPFNRPTAPPRELILMHDLSGHTITKGSVITARSHSKDGMTAIQGGTIRSRLIGFQRLTQGRLVQDGRYLLRGLLRGHTQLLPRVERRCCGWA